jgi:hypothetical protein
MCGAEPGPKLCMSCSGECATCTEAPTPPRPGAATTSGWHGCLTALAKSLPCCDATRTIDERVDWLMANLTLQEKIRTNYFKYLGRGCT